MKKFLCILLCLVFLLSVASCGKDEKGSDESFISFESGIFENDFSSDDEQSSVDTESKDGAPFEQFDENGNYIPLNYDFPKIMKLTQWDLSENILLTGGGSPQPKASFTKKVQTIMKNIKDGGYNTVLLQIRPFADSFYESEYYPLSYFVTGSYANQTVKYDAVQVFIDEAHKSGLSIHGWINPMRCMTKNEIEKIQGEWAITEWYSHMGDDGKMGEYMFAGTDAGGTARLYINPAYEDVRNLIINGIDEILTKYKVDGIFMDDYFYPEEVKNKTEIDAKAFASRTDGSTTLHEFRCNNVNTLIRGIYSKVKEHGEELIYGISPNGDISHAYGAECADIYTWCSESGYCDIMYPQFYYGMLHGQASISVLMKEWNSVLTEKSIKLVPILTVHKSGALDTWAVTSYGREEWMNYSDVVLQSLTYLLINEYRPLDGVGFFCYAYFYGDKQTAPIKSEIDSFTPIWYEYETLIGKDKALLKQYYNDKGLDLKALGDEWDERLEFTGMFDTLFNID